MKKVLMLGLLASFSTAQAGSLTAKPSFPSYSKPAAPAHAPAAPSSGPVIGRNVPQNNTSAAPTHSTTHSTTPSAPHTPAPATPTAPAPASSGMGGVVGGMAAGALLGAGATMLLSDSPSATAPAANATTAAAPANLVYTGSVEKDFMSAMLLWQNKNYAELIKISEPYTKCTNCGDKDRFMMELHQLGKRYIGQ